jgi:hypothetical protein
MKRIASAIFLLTATSAFAADFRIDDTDGALHVFEGDQPVLVYHYELVEPPEGVDGHFRRTAYIHPLYGLDGTVLTQDFPFDHRHHRGIFWAWPECTVGEKRMDVWALDGARQVHEKWVTKEATAESVTIAAENGWVYDDAPEDPKVRESISFTVHPATDSSRAIDFDLTFTNISTEPVTFLGAENKGYGGFNYRPDAGMKPFTFTTVDGVSEEDQLRYPTPWADVSFQTKKDGPTAGVAFFQHPGNPGYPHPGWIFRHYAFLGVSWPHEETHVLAPGESFRLRYRVYIHAGGAKEAGVETAFAEWTAERAAGE